MPQIVRFLRFDGSGQETIDLDLCLRVVIAPAIESRMVRTPIDWSKVSVYYRTPDFRWIEELWDFSQDEPANLGYIEVPQWEVEHIAVARRAYFPPGSEPWTRHGEPTDLPSPPAAGELADAISEEPDPSELAKLRYVPKTVRRMKEEFDVSTGRCEDVGRRALSEGKILDFKLCRNGKLWILPKESGHPGT